jgi:hypothetical protein
MEAISPAIRPACLNNSASLEILLRYDRESVVSLRLSLWEDHAYARSIDLDREEPDLLGIYFVLHFLLFKDALRRHLGVAASLREVVPR